MSKEDQSVLSWKPVEKFLQQESLDSQLRGQERSGLTSDLGSGHQECHGWPWKQVVL